MQSLPDNALDVLDSLEVQLCSAVDLTLTVEYVLEVPAQCACVYHVRAGRGLLRDGDGGEIPFICDKVFIAPSAASGLVLVPTSHAMSVLSCTVKAMLCGVTNVFEELDQPLVCSLEQGSLLNDILARISCELERKHAGSTTMVDALVTQLLVLMLREHFSSKNPLPIWPTRAINSRLSRVVAAVRRDPAAAHSVAGLAAIAGMSRSAFAKHFVQHLQQSPMEFVKHARLQRAADLLSTTDLPIKVIASRAGYASRSHFSRAFRDAYSIEPSRFRAGTRELHLTARTSNQPPDLRA